MFPLLRAGLQRISQANATASPASFRFFSTFNGTVKWFDIKKGYGFIIPEDGSPDVFVHQSVVHAEGFRSLADGEPVEYTLKTDANGRQQADNVTGPMGAYVQGAPRRTFGHSLGGGPRAGMGGFAEGGGYGTGGFGSGGSGGFGSGGSGDYGSTAETPQMPTMEETPAIEKEEEPSGFGGAGSGFETEAQPTETETR